MSITKVSKTTTATIRFILHTLLGVTKPKASDG